MKNCIYPTFENGEVSIGNHISSKDGFCIICGMEKETNALIDLIRQYEIQLKVLECMSSPIMGYINGIRDGKVKQLIITIADLKKIKCM